MVNEDDLYTRLPSDAPPREHLPMIRDLDVKAFRRKVEVSTDAVALLALHKLRYEWTAIDDKLRRDSGRWLVDRGFGRFLHGAVLPDGVLPKARS